MTDPAPPNAPGPVYPTRRQAFRAAEEQYWKDSEEYKKARKAKWWVITLNVAGIIILVTGIFLAGTREPNTLAGYLGGGTVILGFLCLLLGVLAWYTYWNDNRSQVDARFKHSLLDKYQAREIADASSQDQNQSQSLTNRTVTNENRLDLYHGIATDQSKRAFRLSQVAMAVGLVLVVVMGIAASQAASTAGAVVSGVIAAVGAATSGYIGATFLRAQSEASAQLKEFFLQPVEISRILTVERLIELLESDDLRSENIGYVIRTMMTTGSQSSINNLRAPELKEDTD